MNFALFSMIYPEITFPYEGLSIFFTFAPGAITALNAYSTVKSIQNASGLIQIMDFFQVFNLITDRCRLLKLEVTRMLIHLGI